MDVYQHISNSSNMYLVLKEKNRIILWWSLKHHLKVWRSLNIFDLKKWIPLYQSPGHPDLPSLLIQVPWRNLQHITTKLNSPIIFYHLQFSSHLRKVLIEAISHHLRDLLLLVEELICSEPQATRKSYVVHHGPWRHRLHVGRSQEFIEIRYVSVCVHVYMYSHIHTWYTYIYNYMIIYVQLCICIYIICINDNQNMNSWYTDAKQFRANM